MPACGGCGRLRHVYLGNTSYQLTTEIHHELKKAGLSSGYVPPPRPDVRGTKRDRGAASPRGENAHVRRAGRGYARNGAPPSGEPGLSGHRTLAGISEYVL